MQEQEKAVQIMAWTVVYSLGAEPRQPRFGLNADNPDYHARICMALENPGQGRQAGKAPLPGLKIFIPMQILT